MAGYWAETRPNGKPIEAGTVCWVTEPLDGGHPIFTYGKDQQEVIEKLSRTNAHAQAALARKSAPAPNPSTPAAVPARLSADDVMQATQDLQNPAKAGSAVAKLVQDATGIDLGQIALNNFAALAMEWEEDNPDFYSHPGNQRLLIDRAKAHVDGSLARVTKAHLTQAFDELSHAGVLFERPQSANPQPETPSTFPAENQAQRVERPRGSRFATSTRSTSFRAAPQAPGQTRTPKYTAEEIRTMPESKSRQLIADNDPEYAHACDFHFGEAATA